MSYGSAQKLRRCIPCGINWPFNPGYDHCAGCGLPTEEGNTRVYGPALSYADGASLKKRLQDRAKTYIDFDVYLARRTREHRQMCGDYDADQLRVARLIVTGAEQLLASQPTGLQASARPAEEPGRSTS